MIKVNLSRNSIRIDLSPPLIKVDCLKICWANLVRPSTKIDLSWTLARNNSFRALVWSTRFYFDQIWLISNLGQVWLVSTIISRVNFARLVSTFLDHYPNLTHLNGWLILIFSQGQLVLTFDQSQLFSIFN